MNAFFENGVLIMVTTSNFLKSGFLALSLAVLAPMAAHAAPGGLANDPSLISEINAAYGTSFVAHNAPAPAAHSQASGQN